MKKRISAAWPQLRVGMFVQTNGDGSSTRDEDELPVRGYISCIHPECFYIESKEVKGRGCYSHERSDLWAVEKRSSGWIDFEEIENNDIAENGFSANLDLNEDEGLHLKKETLQFSRCEACGLDADLRETHCTRCGEKTKILNF